MIFRYFDRSDWMYTVFAVVFVLFQVYLNLAIPGYMNDITVALELGNQDVVNERGVLMLTYAFLSILCALGNGYCAAKVSANLSFHLRELQYRNVLRFSKQDVDSFSAASLITRSTNDVYQIQMFVARGLHIFVEAPVLAIGALAIILTKDWHWTAVTAAGVLVLVVVIAVTLAYTVKRFKKIQILMDGLNDASRENINGMRVIRAYNAEEHQQRKFDAANDAMLRNDLEVTRAMSVMFPLMQSLMSFLTMAIYWVGAVLIMEAGNSGNQIQLFGDMVVFSSYAIQMMSAFLMMAGIFRMLPRASVSSKRISEVIEHVLSVSDSGTEKINDCTIRFDHVSFRYPGTESDVLHDVSFEVHPGETLAIIGPTGSGKSTLVSLMMRFYDPCDGSVSVGGRDVRLCSLEAVRGIMGYVPQNAVIFDGTVRDNVNYGSCSEDRTDDDVRHALEVAQAKEFVDKMPEGIDSHISQYGRNLSGGQKQRICIARAVCRRPEVYVMDDCFSALDYMTDLKVREALAEESGSRIRIIVAQRLGTIMDADRILVLDNGRIAGSGTHAELLEKCPLYREIAASQMSEVKR